MLRLSLIHLEKNYLKGIAEDPNDVPQFTNFMLAAEPVSTNPNHQTPLGIITVKNGDPMVMYSGRCRNSIKESSSSMKSQISVRKRHQMILLLVLQTSKSLYHSLIDLSKLFLSGNLDSSNRRRPTDYPTWIFCMHRFSGNGHQKTGLLVHE